MLIFVVSYIYENVSIKINNVKTLKENMYTPLILTKSISLLIVECFCIIFIGIFSNITCKVNIYVGCLGYFSPLKKKDCSHVTHSFFFFGKFSNECSINCLLYNSMTGPQKKNVSALFNIYCTYLYAIHSDISISIHIYIFSNIIIYAQIS